MIILAVGVLLSTSVAVAGSSIVVPPETSWAELKPYIEANVRLDQDENGVVVGASSATAERDLFEPYDPLMGELATVLLMEIMSDKKAGPVMVELADSLSADVSAISMVDHDELIAMYWERLEADGRVLERAERIYRRAQKKGRIRCSICDEGFEPQHLTLI